MKRTLLSVKELAHQLGISADSVYRAYRRKEIPAAQINRMIRFDFEKVCQAMEKKARGLPNREYRKQGATGGAAAGSRSRIAPGKTGAEFLGVPVRAPYGGSHECMDMFARVVSLYRA